MTKLKKKIICKTCKKILYLPPSLATRKVYCSMSCKRSDKNLFKAIGEKNKKRCINKEKKEYKMRVIVKRGPTSDVYGLTIPYSIVEKYKLKDKIFKINVSPMGKFILYTKLNEAKKK